MEIHFIGSANKHIDLKNICPLFKISLEADFYCNVLTMTPVTTCTFNLTDYKPYTLYLNCYKPYTQLRY